MDILDWLENQKGAEHRIAADEIKLLRANAIPDGYVLVRREPSDEMIECLTHEWDSIGATSMYENYQAMIEAALKTQKATT